MLPDTDDANAVDDAPRDEPATEPATEPGPADDAPTTGSDSETAALAADGLGKYPHVMRTVIDRPWALQPAMLSMIVDIVRFRATGGTLSEEEIVARLEAAAAANGDRSSGRDGTWDVGSVRVIPVYGIVSQRMSLMSLMSGGTSLDKLRSQLRSALEDEGVTAIAMQFDSPGGSVDGLTEFAAELRSVRGGPKPILAIADSMAASAAYWLATQVDELIVTPSGSVGSVGVFAAHEDVSAAEEMAGVKVTLISAGPHKTEGNEHEPLTDEARAAIQDHVDTFYSMFLSDVAKGRELTAAQVAANYGGGREVLAQAALKAGMVDRVDTLENTVRRLLPRQGRSGRAAAESGAIEVEGAAPDLPAIAAVPAAAEIPAIAAVPAAAEIPAIAAAAVAPTVMSRPALRHYVGAVDSFAAVLERNR